MSKKKGIPATWHLLVDKKTNSLLMCHPTLNPEFFSDSAKNKYVELGTMVNKDDADRFIEYKELGIEPDAVAYLINEHKVKEGYSKSKDMDPIKLVAMIEDVRRETGRCCFGACKSLEGASACATCFSAKKETWTLCSLLKLLLEKNRSEIDKNKNDDDE